MEPLGLIAGQGVFPHLVAAGAKAAGRRVICVGLGSHADASLAGECDVFRRVGVLRLGGWARVLRKHGCREAVMVGRVAKGQVHSRWRYFQYVPDLAAVRLLAGTLRRDKRDFAILGAVADTLADRGITLIDSTQYAAEHLTTDGVLTSHAPTDTQSADIAFGWPLAKLLSTNDVGQALAVRERDVIAVEAVEGTDAMIERAGRLCRGKSWVLIKVANATLDPRFDVPCVGTGTIEKLASAGCGCLVLEAGKTMMLEKPAVLAAAEKAGIAVVGKR
ncbi:MAG: UDP-2,3-diacylglucosamine diphosphatase LpxI [Planctomycetota bacterium]